MEVIKIRVNDILSHARHYRGLILLDLRLYSKLLSVNRRRSEPMHALVTPRCKFA